MFEYHGWLVLELLTPFEQESDDYNWEEYANQQKAFRDKFWTIINDYHLEETAHECTRGQWKYMFAFHGFHNHCRTVIYELFQWVAQHSKGSYGILYVHDGEDEYAMDFRVWVLKQSQFTEHGDPFISPLIPRVGFPARGEPLVREKGSFH